MDECAPELVLKQSSKQIGNGSFQAVHFYTVVQKRLLLDVVPKWNGLDLPVQSPQQTRWISRSDC